MNETSNPHKTADYTHPHAPWRGPFSKAAAAGRKARTQGRSVGVLFEWRLLKPGLGCARGRLAKGSPSIGRNRSAEAAKGDS